MSIGLGDTVLFEGFMRHVDLIWKIEYVYHELFAEVARLMTWFPSRARKHGIGFSAHDVIRNTRFGKLEMWLTECPYGFLP